MRKITADFNGDLLMTPKMAHEGLFNLLIYLDRNSLSWCFKKTQSFGKF
jgi:hypothetical protein